MSNCVIVRDATSLTLPSGCSTSLVVRDSSAVVLAAAAAAGPQGPASDVTLAGDNTFTGDNTFDEPLAVAAATAAGDAAQVTALDGTTNRLAIGGYELGDTEWRDVSGDLLNDWTGTLLIRRSGAHVQIRGDALANGTSAIAYTVPSGFTGDHVQGPVGVALTSSGNTSVAMSGFGWSTFLGGASFDSLRIGTSVVRLEGSWLTSDAWPSSLPGTAA